MRRAAPRAAVVVALAALGCVTTPKPWPERIDALGSAAGRCGSYATFREDAARFEAEALRAAPAEHLLAAQAQARRARLVCARASLRLLGESAAGASQFQRELDVLAQDFTEGALRALVRDELGARADELSPLVSLALATAQSERLTLASQSLAAAAPLQDDALPTVNLPLDAPPEALVRDCAGRGGVEALRCLGAVPASAPGRAAAADLAVGRARAASGGGTAEGLARVLGAARGVATAPVVDDVERALRAACELRVAQARPLVERGQAVRAAAQLAPCRTVAGADAARSFEAAAAALDAEATAAQARGLGLAAQLARAVKVALTGEGSPTLRPEPGAWDVSRVQCHRALPPPPDPVPPGLRLRLVGRCVLREAKRGEATAAPEATFEQEKAMKSEGFQGEVLAACGDELLRLPVDVRDVLLDGPWGGEANGVDAALMSRLQTVLAEAQAKCRQLRERAEVGACGRLSSADHESMEQLFVELGVALGRWAPCFVEAYRARTGVELQAAWLR